MAYNLEFEVTHQSIKLHFLPVASGSVAYLTAHFAFTDDWDGLTKTASFTHGTTNVSRVINADNEITAADNLNLSEAGAWTVSIYGTDSTGTRITTKPVRLYVALSKDGATTEEITLYQQAVSIASEARDIAQSVKDAANAGEFNGADGYSPTANVTKSGTSATITITDKNGTTTAIVSDGAKGDKGDTGATGATGADGYSPTLTVSKVGTVTTVTATDKNGTTTSEIKDGETGSGASVTAENIASALGYTPGDAENVSANTESLSTVKNDIKNFIGNESYTFTKDYSVDKGTLTPKAESGWEYVIADCSEGDVFYVKGKGGTSTVLWCFAKNDGTSVLYSAAGTLAEDYIEITAPANATKLVVNSNYSVAEGGLIKGIIALSSAVNTLKNNVSTLQNGDGSGTAGQVWTALTDSTAGWKTVLEDELFELIEEITLDSSCTYMNRTYNLIDLYITISVPATDTPTSTEYIVLCFDGNNTNYSFYVGKSVTQNSAMYTSVVFKKVHGRYFAITPTASTSNTNSIGLCSQNNYFGAIAGNYISKIQFTNATLPAGTVIDIYGVRK